MKLFHLFDFDSLQLWIPTSFVQPPRDTLWWIYVVSWRLDQEFLTFSSSRKWGKPRNCDGISTRYCCEMEEMLNLVFFFCSSSLKLRSQILWWIFQRTSTARTKISLWSIFSQRIFKNTRFMSILFISRFMKVLWYFSFIKISENIKFKEFFYIFIKMHLYFLLCFILQFFSRKKEARKKKTAEYA